MKTALNPLPVSWDEVDQLITQLHSWGVNYLVGLDHGNEDATMQVEQVAPTMLLRRLAVCDEYPRVRDASIALFLLHPELANNVQELLRNGRDGSCACPDIAERVAVLTLATLYLQRLWSCRLTLALGRLPCFPEQQFAFLWRSRNLPPPACHNGQWGLMELQTWEQRRTGLPFTYIGDWQNQVNHLLRQEEVKLRHAEAPITLREDYPENEEGCDMSMRPGVDKAAIESFLQQLGRTFHKAGRLYLVGGAALIHAGIRPGFTLDIDVQVGGANEGELIVAIQRLIQQMQVNVKFASPADFIPLPTQWEMHAKYVGRYGGIEVFYFDFYTIALSKVERGNDRDMRDVKLLIDRSIITLDDLDTAYQEAQSQLGKGQYPRLTPERFSERYKSVRQLLEVD